MKKTRKIENQQKVIEVQEQSVDVLYQKMGNHWFAFSLIGDEVFLGSIHVNDLCGNGAQFDEITPNQCEF